MANVAEIQGRSSGENVMDMGWPGVEKDVLREIENCSAREKTAC